MNPSTALATVLIDELVRNKVNDVVLSPGSRNAPLSLALHAADAAGRLRLHVRIDERTAGFLALGLAKRAEWPVAVVTTSGTAAVNLHPAVVEAHHAGVPLVLLTADRPVELRGVGANQTIEQPGLFGPAVRAAVDLPAPESYLGQNATWRSILCRLLGSARGELTRDPGPVHLNVAFRDPLLPDGAELPAGLVGRDAGKPWTDVLGHKPWTRSDLDASSLLGDEPRTLVLLGAAPTTTALAACSVAERGGWPLVVEPVVPFGFEPPALDAGGLVIGAGEWVEQHLPARVLVVGRPTLSRGTAALLGRDDVEVVVVGEHDRWVDVTGTASAVLAVDRLHRAAQGAPQIGERWGDPAFLNDWETAGLRARKALDALLSSQPALTGPSVAREVVASLPERSLLVLGSSSSVRDVAVGASPPARVQLLANRGTAGIDGTVSTAIGAALEHQRNEPLYACALMGDLTFLHDSNGLVIGSAEPRPDLTIVVNNDDGGGIFGLLEQGAAKHGHAFERVFGTPHGVDIESLCAATHTWYSLVTTTDDLRAALAPRAGIGVVEVRTDRRARRELDRRLRDAVADALRG